MVLDAETTLDQILVDGMPAANLFHSLMEETLASINTGSPRDNVRAYGEMVDLLWRRGHTAAAIQLEELWNAFLAERPVSLLCAYMMGSFYNKRAAFTRFAFGALARLAPRARHEGRRSARASPRR